MTTSSAWARVIATLNLLGLLRKPTLWRTSTPTNDSLERTCAPFTTQKRQLPSILAAFRCCYLKGENNCQIIATSGEPLKINKFEMAKNWNNNKQNTNIFFLHLLSLGWLLIRSRNFQNFRRSKHSPLRWWSQVFLGPEIPPQIQPWLHLTPNDQAKDEAFLPTDRI